MDGNNNANQSFKNFVHKSWSFKRGSVVTFNTEVRDV